MNNKEFIKEFLQGMDFITANISQESIEHVIDHLYAAWKRGSTLFIAGNGGSASTATHFACDLAKCTVVEGKKRLRVLSLVDNIPLVSALTNDNGWDHVYSEQLKSLFQPGDVFIAFSVHGGSGQDKAGAWSQNLLRAMQYAKEHKGSSIGFAGFDGGAMKQAADVCVVVPYNTTPHVEAFHVVLHHLIAFRLAELIRDER